MKENGIKIGDHARPSLPLLHLHLFQKNLLIEVEDKGAAGEDEGGAVEDEGGDDENIEPELDDEDAALNRQSGPIGGSGGGWGRK